MLSKPILEQLIRADPDRLRSAGLADTTLREELQLLYAFHYELAKVPEIVSDPMIGQIRYQWWRDAIAEIYEDRPVRSHEITTPLAALLKRSEMPRFWVDRLIDARARDLDPTPFLDLNAAKDYCALTSGTLMQMGVYLAQSGGGNSEMDMDGVLKAGTAWGLTGLARSWRFYHETMLSALDFTELCAASQDHYKQASTALGTIPAQIIPALAYASLTPQYVKRMSSSRHNRAHMMPSYAPLLKTLRLMKVSILGRL